MELKYISRRDLEELLRLSRSTIYSMMAKGQFPKPTRLGAKAVRWSEAEIKDWLSNRQRVGSEQ